MPTVAVFAILLVVSLVSCLVLVGGLLSLMRVTNTDRQLQASIMEYQQLQGQQKPLNAINSVHRDDKKASRRTNRRKLRDVSESVVPKKALSGLRAQQSTSLLHRIKQVEKRKGTTSYEMG